MRLANVLLLAGLLPAPLVAQNPTAMTPTDMRNAYLADMAKVEQKVVGLAEAFPAEKYAWRPGAGVRSVAEALMLIAAEHYLFMPQSVGSGPPADLNMGAGMEVNNNLEKVSAKADVIRHVKAAFAYQKSVLEKADAKIASGKVTAFGRERTVYDLFTIFLADQHEHLGQLIAYARMNGIVPPWSQKSGS